MASIAEVADIAGVSATTASFVLNGRAREMRIGRATERRVLEAARHLGYSGNYAARTLQRGRSMTLGFVMPHDNPDLIRAAVTAGVLQGAAENGYEVLNVGTAGNGASDPVERGVRYLQGRRVDGLVLFTPPGTGSDDTVRAAAELPVVQVWFTPAGDLPVVSLDPAPGLRQAAQLLAELGHRRVTWLGVSGANGHARLPERLGAFLETAHEHGLTVHERSMADVVGPRWSGALDVGACCNALERARFDPADSTAVVCYNDSLAGGLCAWLARCGLRVPEDVSVIGFDDLQAACTAPPLTTVSHMLLEMGRVAAREVVNMALHGGPSTPLRPLLVPSQLVVRGSTAAAPDRAPLNRNERPQQ